MEQNSIASLERRKVSLRADIAAEIARHKEKVDAIQWEFREAEERIQRISNDIDESACLLAEHVIRVGGLYVKAGDERASALNAAVAELVRGGGRLFSEYIGTKSYDRWHGQHVSHEYGMGPRHGRMIFSIELSRPVRDRGSLTEDEINAALYYLRNIERIQAAHQAAKAAA